jgi:hypothetical protein
MDVEKRLKNALAEAEIGLKRLEIRIRDTDEAAREKMQDAKVAMIEKRDAARRHLEEMKALGAKSWEKVKAVIVGAVEDLERISKEVSSRYRLTESGEE